MMTKPPAVATKPVTEAQIIAIAEGKTTWAEAMGLTQQEAFGLAQSAYRFFEFGQHARGKTIMEGLIVMNPKVAAFHALMGAMHGRLGDEAAAEKSYSTAITLEPLNLSARVNRAEMFLKQGVLDRALDDLLAATKADPQQKSVLGKRAWRLARTTSTALKELMARAPRRPAGPPAKR